MGQIRRQESKSDTAQSQLIYSDPEADAAYIRVAKKAKVKDMIEITA